MTNPSVSVVVVSRGRPRLLELCLLAISQLGYDNFEIVVVADQVGLDAVAAAGFQGRVKSTLCEVANIAIARNIGLQHASGEVVAFLDDDCVPEPGWLSHLAAVFQDTKVEAAGGYVRGRNGISFQYTAQTIDAQGISAPIDIPGSSPVIMQGTADTGIKTEGTNCAFRRTVFERLGGFDPAFAYYLDDSDINLRLGKIGGKTALVPLAQVHHQTAASYYRRANRMPHDLQQVGKSTAIFLRKHCQDDDHELILDHALETHRKRLLQQMYKGNCKRRDVTRVLKSLKTGFGDGRIAPLAAAPPVAPPTQGFLKFENAGPAQHRCISGYRLHTKKLRRQARASVAAGNIVSLYIFSRTALYHHVRFHADGYWQQTGGLFGRSIRKGRFFCLNSLQARVAQECDRVALVRHPLDSQ